jgi:hypothetical protein
LVVTDDIEAVVDLLADRHGINDAEDRVLAVLSELRKRKSVGGTDD